MKVKLYLTKKEALRIARQFDENVDAIIIHSGARDEDIVALYLKNITETNIDETHVIFRAKDNDRTAIIIKLEGLCSIKLLKDEATE